MRARLLVCALIATALLIPATPGATATPAWSVTSGSTSATTVQLSAVSCVSATSCMAVGRIGNNTATSKAYAESWNGKKWSVTPVPGPKGSWLFGVSCVSATFCQAVGWADNDTNALTERWNGQAWVRVANPLHGSTLASLSSVSCVARDWCVAVGNYFDESAGYTRTLIERWNGKAWSLVGSPNRGTVSSTLFGVSCASRTWCTAVGNSFVGSFSGPSHTLIERWNGKAWIIVATPNPVPNDYQILRGVSCASAASCTAVGRSVNGTLVESWNGRFWALIPSPSKDLGNELDGVDCASAASCQAVGSVSGSTLSESWDGHVWSITPSPNAAKGYNALAGVSCISAVSCTAVGPGNFIFAYR